IISSAGILSGIAFDAKREHIYVVDSEKGVFKYDRDGTNEVLVIPKTEDISTIAVDSNGAIYWANYVGDKVMKLSMNATSSIIIAGGNGKGNGTNQFWNPYGILVDRLGTLYITDTMNSRIVRVPSDGGAPTIITGEQGQLRYPVNVTFDRAGNLD
ncbi:unnamed protein product, partial [Adineta ricciae]